MEYFRIKYITDDGPFVRIKSDNPPTPEAEDQFIIIDDEGTLLAQLININVLRYVVSDSILINDSNDSFIIITDI